MASVARQSPQHEIVRVSFWGDCRAALAMTND